MRLELLIKFHFTETFNIIHFSFDLIAFFTDCFSIPQNWNHASSLPRNHSLWLVPAATNRMDVQFLFGPIEPVRKKNSVKKNSVTTWGHRLCETWEIKQLFGFFFKEKLSFFHVENKTHSPANCQLVEDINRKSIPIKSCH